MSANRSCPVLRGLTLNVSGGERTIPLLLVFVLDTATVDCLNGREAAQSDYFEDPNTVSLDCFDDPDTLAGRYSPAAYATGAFFGCTAGPFGGCAVGCIVTCRLVFLQGGCFSISSFCSDWNVDEA